MPEQKGTIIFSCEKPLSLLLSPNMKKLFVLLSICFSLFSAPPKVVVFDYGGVVANVDRKPLLEYLSQSLEIPYKQVKKDFTSDALYQALPKPLSFWEEYAGKNLSKNWYKDFQQQKLKIVQDIPGVKELIVKLKAQGVQVALLSNTNVARARFIENLGGYDLFDPILLSCHLGIGKPHPKIYDRLLEYIAFKPNECVFIDNKKSNVRAGMKKGIDGIHFQSIDQLKEELRKRELVIE